MPLPGRCLSAGTLIQYYDATNVEPTQRDQPFISSKKSPISEHINAIKENNFFRASRRGPKPRMTVLARTCSDLFSMDLDLYLRFIIRNYYDAYDHC
jgi:hypothetical protein